MIPRPSLFRALFIFLLGCTSSQQPTPDYLIAEEKMVEIMVDMHLVETANNLKLLAPDSVESTYPELFSSIYATHAVTRADFDSSLFYYSTETQQMTAIYDKVLERLYELESEVKADH